MTIFPLYLLFQLNLEMSSRNTENIIQDYPPVKTRILLEELETIRPVQINARSSLLGYIFPVNIFKNTFKPHIHI